MSAPSFIIPLTILGNCQEQVIPSYLFIMMIRSFIVIGLIAVYLLWFVAKYFLAKAPADESVQLEQIGQTFLLQLGGVCFVVHALVDLPRTLGSLQSSKEVSYINFLSQPGLLLQLCIGQAVRVD